MSLSDTQKKNFLSDISILEDKACRVLPTITILYICIYFWAIQDIYSVPIGKYLIMITTLCITNFILSFSLNKFTKLSRNVTGVLLSIWWAFFLLYGSIIETIAPKLLFLNDRNAAALLPRIIVISFFISTAFLAVKYIKATKKIYLFVAIYLSILSFSNFIYIDIPWKKIVHKITGRTKITSQVAEEQHMTSPKSEQIGFNVTETKSSSTEEAITYKYMDYYPDIYYIILDGYNRQDALNKYLEIDNSEFISFLKNTGFYIGNKSLANYATTRLSLYSSLNMSYFTDEQIKNGNLDLLSMNGIMNPDIVNRLKKIGYDYHLVSSGTTITDTSPIANYTHSFDWSLKHLPFSYSVENESTRYFFSRTLLRELVPDIADQRLFLFKALENISNKHDAPKFTFCHMLLPHTPYVFDRNGKKSEIRNTTLTHMGNSSNPIQDKEGYSEQIYFLNKRIKKTIEEIIKNSDRHPIIIIQGDHGSWNTAYSVNASSGIPEPEERMPILNAYYAPRDIKESLYETITPVNTFRVILNKILEENIEALDDASYFSWYEALNKLEPYKEY